MANVTPKLLALPLLGLATLLPLTADAVAPPEGPEPAPIETTAEDPGTLPDSEIQELQRELEGILASTGNRSGRYGVLAVSLDRNDTLVALNAGEVMVPASNMKLLTTAAAFHFLGPDFRYQTFLLAGDPSPAPILEGDLIVYGTGDPTLSNRYYPTEAAAMDSLANLVVRAGIEEIRGNLVVDGSFFSGPDLHPDWEPEDLNDAFAAPITAASLNENVVRLRVEAGAWLGARPTIHTFPPGAGIPIYNLGTTVAPRSRSRIWLLRENPRDPIGIEGEIPLGGADVWRSLPVPDPLAFLGTQLRRSLAARGIRIEGRIVPVRRSSASPLSALTLPLNGEGNAWPRVLGVHSSPPLRDLLRVVNKESNNLFAETVAKTLGRVVVGEGSFTGGQQAISKFLIEEVGVSSDAIRIRDGSGLSNRNGASPAVFVHLLAYMARSDCWEEFWETLPEAGVRRELGRMYRSAAAGNLRAKTGTMNGVSALSGMVRTRAGERILFSILSNDVSSEYGAKRAEDRIGIRLASLTRPLPGDTLG